MSVPWPEFTGDEPCSQVDPELFFEFPSNGQVTFHMRFALSMCRLHCPLMWACRKWALHHEEFGIWGGTLPEQRRRIRREQGITLERIDHQQWIPARWKVAG